MAKITVVGVDPSKTNFGMVKADIDMDTLDITILDMAVIETASEAKKGVIKQSDDLRRAKETRAGMLKFFEGAKLAFSELPFTNPNGYASANFNAGLVVGILAGCPTPLIQVFPADVKMAAIGHRQASKEEMIAWAMNKYPNAPWRMRKLKGNMVPVAINEHLADACAAIEAGVLSQQFQQLQAMYSAKAA